MRVKSYGLGRVEHELRIGVLRLLRQTSYIGWVLRGRPSGVSHSYEKRSRLRTLAKEFACSTFVETGTYLGDTVAAMRRHFKRVLSVELSPELYRDARRRFAHTSNVSVFQGDSSAVLPLMLPQIVGRALFWLDGHYSGAGTALGSTECPLTRELDAIETLNRRDHVIVIDDARFLGHHPDYPSLEDARAQLLRINPGYSIAVEDDFLVARPPLEASP